MKIKKFNESNSDKLDEPYIKFIFEEFLDKDENEIHFDKDKNSYFEIFIKEPLIIIDSEINFEDYEKNIEDLLNFSKTLKSCIDKVKEEYPDINVNFDFDSVEVGSKIKRDLHLSFYL
jgi:hypothetical protein